MMASRSGLKPLVGACFLAAFVLALLASATVYGPALPRAARGATTWQVAIESDTMGGYMFSPERITVNVGDTVTWVDMLETHTTTSDPGQAESWNSGPMNETQSFSHTFNIPGTYRYTSTIESGLVGEIMVEVPVPEFPGLFALAAIGLAVCVGLAHERAFRLRP
jgi:plastocyanin